jgi:hypothetical protein
VSRDEVSSAGAGAHDLSVVDLGASDVERVLESVDGCINSGGDVALFFIDFAVWNLSGKPDGGLADFNRSCSFSGLSLVWKRWRSKPCKHQSDGQLSIGHARATDACANPFPNTNARVAAEFQLGFDT